MDTQNQIGKSLIKGVAIYTIGNFGSKILSFLIVPLYTYYISTSDMGIYDLLTATINLLSPIITFQISEAAYRWIIRSSDQSERKKYIRSTYQVLLFNSTIVVALILIVNSFFKIPYLEYFIVTLLLTRSHQTVTKLLRGIQNQKLFAVCGILYTAVFLTSNILQICFFKRGIVGLFSSTMIASIFILLFILARESRLRINIFEKPDFSIIRMMLKYSLPLIPNSLNWWVINSSDKFIVNHYIGLSASGLLAITHKFPNILQSILELFTIAWQDVSVSEIKSEGKAYSSIFAKYYFFAFTFLWFLIPATKAATYYILSESYKPSSNFISFYYLGTTFQAFSSFFGVGYLKNKNTKSAFVTSIYAALINILINVALIGTIGIHAASISTFVAFFAMWLVRFKQNKEELEITINWMKFGLLTLSTVFISVFSIFSSSAINLFVSTIMLIVFSVLNFSLIIRILQTVHSFIRRNSNHE